MREEDREEFKEAVKEAAKEWLNEQFAAFGKWTAVGIGAAVFFFLFKLGVAAGLIEGWGK